MTVTFNEIGEFHAADFAKGDDFGYAVATAGSIVVVGAPNDDDNGRDSGSAYVFRYDDNGSPADPTDDIVTQLAKLTSSDGARRNAFGGSVAAAGDDENGYTIAVGDSEADGTAGDAGAVYIFQDISAAGDWSATSETKLYASDGAAGDYFAARQALSIHGNTIVVGAERHNGSGSQSGAIYLFEDTSAAGDWTQITETKLLGNDTQAGDRLGVSVSIAGNTLAAGAYDARATYVFERDLAGNWGQQAKLTRDDGGPLGWGTAVSPSGGFIVASDIWRTYVFERGAGWADAGTDTSASQTACTSIGAPCRLIPDDPSVDLSSTRFGWSVAAAADTIAVGAVSRPSGGAAYLFEMNGSNWVPSANLLSNDEEGSLGYSTAILGTTVLAGDHSDDAEGQPGGPAEDAGSVYLFAANVPEPVAGITVSPTSGLVTTESGGTDSFSVVLDKQPIADVTIGLSIDAAGTGEGSIDTSSLTFTPVNWNVAQTVTVTGVDDAVEDGDINYTILTAAAVSTDLAYNGVNPSDIVVTNEDDDGPVAITMHISDLDSSTSTGSRGRWNASVTITVRDANGNPVANANVSGSWSDGASGSSTCTTDVNGECIVTMNNLKKTVSSVTFTVTGIAHATNVYDPTDNEDLEGDSNGTNITIVKP